MFSRLSALQVSSSMPQVFNIHSLYSELSDNCNQEESWKHLHILIKMIIISHKCFDQVSQEEETWYFVPLPAHNGWIKLLLFYFYKSEGVQYNKRD